MSESKSGWLVGWLGFNGTFGAEKAISWLESKCVYAAETLNAISMLHDFSS